MKVRQIKQRLSNRRRVLQHRVTPLFRTVYVVYRNKDAMTVAEVDWHDEAEALVAKAKAAKKASLSFRRETRQVA
jgi:hypothetical protein